MQMSHVVCAIREAPPPVTQTSQARSPMIRNQTGDVNTSRPGTFAEYPVTELRDVSDGGSG